jgi:hypothetical protein
MKREEYEKRKRRLETQLQEGIELLKAGFRDQLRTLEMVWTTTAEEEETPPQAPAEARREERPAALDQTPAAPQPPESSRPRQKRGQLWKDIDAALEHLPQVFNRHHLVKALGYEPDRASLHRVMKGLVEHGVIRLKAQSVGKYPADYEIIYDEEEEESASAATAEEKTPAS